MITMVNRIKLLKQLEKYPVFTVKNVKDIIDKKSNYAKLVVHRLKKAGLIFELERNKYTVCKDPWIIASHIVWPSYISSWAAIRYYNLTEQLPTYIQVITTRPKKRRNITFSNTTIEFIRIKKENFSGFGKVAYGNADIFIAEKEKALVDALYLRHITYDTFYEILQEHLNEINIRKLTDYLKKMKMKNTIKRLKEARIDDNKR